MDKKKEFVVCDRWSSLLLKVNQCEMKRLWWFRTPWQFMAPLARITSGPLIVRLRIGRFIITFYHNSFTSFKYTCCFDGRVQNIPNWNLMSWLLHLVVFPSLIMHCCWYPIMHCCVHDHFNIREDINNKNIIIIYLPFFCNRITIFVIEYAQFSIVNP